MSTSPESRRLGRRLILQVVFAGVIIGVMLGGIYLGSFAVHFVWLILSDAPVQTAADAPAWLLIPSFAIGMGFFGLINRYARLIDRLVRACHR